MTIEQKFQRELVELMIRYIAEEDMQMKTCIHYTMGVARGLPLLMQLGAEEE